MFAGLADQAVYHVILLCGRWLVGLVLLVAAATKFKAADGTLRTTVKAYGLLPKALVGPVAAFLPWFELSIGLSLLLGLVLPFPALAAAAMFLAFSLGISINLIRGRRDIDCGCFGKAGQKLSWWLVGRNVLLALIAILSSGWVLAPSGGTSQSTGLAWEAVRTGDAIIIVFVTTQLFAVLLIAWLMTRLVRLDKDQLRAAPYLEGELRSARRALSRSVLLPVFSDGTDYIYGEG